MDELIMERPSFQKLMEDGVVTDEKIEEQGQRVKNMILQMEPNFTPEQKDQIYDLVAEVSVLFRGTMLSPDGFECAENTVGFLVRTIYTKKREETTRNLPAVLHSCWRSSSGKCALVLANYTGREQPWKYGAHEGLLKPHSYARIELEGQIRS